MIRYISVHWGAGRSDCKDKIAIVRSRINRHLANWRATYENREFTVFCPDGGSTFDQICLSNGDGIVFGSLFPKPTEAVPHALSGVVTLSRTDSQRVVQTRGRSLVSEFWGSYVAFLADPERKSSHVLRGPMSDIKCFHATYGPLHLFFSNLDDLANLSLIPLTVNWGCIRAQAACADFIGRQTAICEVSALEGGESIEALEEKVVRTFYWHPCDVAKSSNIRDFNTAASAVGRTTNMCVQSWAARYGRIVHTLSGGLDSSVSVSCVRKSLQRQNMLCVNYFTEDPIGDERGYARDVAEYVDVELREIKREPSVDLGIFKQCVKTAWPMLDFSGYAQYRNEIGLAKEFGALAIFTGEFGDNVFEQGAGADGAADYVRRFGIGPGLLNIAIECALRRNFSIWHVLRRAIVDGLSRQNSGHFKSHSYLERELRIPVSELTLLRPEALADVQVSAERFMHPWLDRIETISPAKYMMIYGLYAMGSHEPPFASADDLPFVAPLGSQPLVEVCLQVPTCFCIRNGLDRAVVRSAFSRELPQSVINRTTKGTPEPWTRDVLRRNQAFLKEFLLEGLLVSQGVLDPKRVEAALSNEVTGSRVFVGDVVEQLYIEAWLRNMIQTRTSVAA